VPSGRPRACSTTHPSPDASSTAPSRGVPSRLQGPLIAAMTLLAFAASMFASGWRPGDPFPTGTDLAVASGAAFMTIVLAQTANAFACRSRTRTPAELGWTSNRLLVAAVTAELAFAIGVIVIAPVAARLDHAPPNAVGWTFAVLAAGMVLVADAADKRRRRRAGGGPARPPDGPFGPCAR
jgi:magnesium-transporting ATPase (P-type)